jgi:hypothetical protein
MPDWIDDYKQSKQEETRKDRLDMEASVNEERRYQAVVLEWWNELCAKLRSDSERLGDVSVQTTETSITIEKAHQSAILRVGIAFSRDARQIRVVYSHSEDGVAIKQDRRDLLLLHLVGGRIELHGGEAPVRLIEEFSKQLLTGVLRQEDGTVRPWNS